MSERGMIFNAEMVNAILSGRKTQTRRPIKWKQTRFTEIAERDDGSLWPWAEDCERGGDIWFACPYGEIGDRIWVRETWQVIHDHIDESSHVEYRTYAPSIPKEKDRYWHTVYAEHFGDESREDRGFPWRPAIHMPRWASRILLEIIDVRVERLNSITESDAEAEGVTDTGFGDLLVDGFRYLWKSIYGDDSWQANPWVWVIEFKRVEGGAA
ncbi:TPA: hypothetical protein I5W11_003994 [Salmonella enterica subsp. enterica serovar Napoli]|nr:hypothetical protein [Salmonella enterica subsp. enterica serovar Napoli]